MKRFESISKLYSHSLKKNGATSNAVGWNSTSSHTHRFDILTNQLIDKEDTIISVNDYGCGYGALLKYLIDLKKLQVSEYNGFDISSDMLKTCSEIYIRFTGKLNLFNSSNITSYSDYSIASGTFNVKLNYEDNMWEEFICNKLMEMNTFSKRGFSFNLLTTEVDWKEPHLYYGDPDHWFQYCKSLFSDDVLLIKDYDLFEWTIIVKKN